MSTAEPVPSVDVTTFPHPGLGNASYLINLGDGRTAIIDPQRDTRPYQHEARRRGLRIAYAVETHIHADFVTGSRELAADGATIVAAGDAGLRFDHRGLGDGQRLDLGGLTLEMVATPGHTDHHASWLLRDGNVPAGVFTGGALIVGGVARTDLVAPDRTEALARASYQSLTTRLLTLPDTVPVWPTHGPGSFCSSSGPGEHTSTIGAERRHNPLLTGTPDEDEFVRRLLAGLGTHPRYFDWLPHYNQTGPKVYGAAWPILPALTATQVRRHVADGAQLVDVRPVDQFARSHIPGAISIELRPQFASFLGWVVDPDRPIVFVTNTPTNNADLDDLRHQSLGIGYENLAGHLAGGLTSWTAERLPVAQIPIIGADDLDGRVVVDVRQARETAQGHLPGAIQLELGSIVADAETALPAGQPLVTMCNHGQRSMTGASLLARQRGTTDGITVYTGSAHDWADHTGRAIVA